MTRPFFALVLAACGRQPVEEAPPPNVEPSTSPTANPTTPNPTPTTDPATEDPATTIPCTPPTLLALTDIPDSPALAAAPETSMVTFEVDGDALVGKAVRNEEAARDALVAWQELVMRVPLNQRTQLVQFTIEGGGEEEGPKSTVDTGGTDNQTGRYGQHLKILRTALQSNDPDVCARLTGQYGTFDWTLVHAVGQLRGHADGSREVFAEHFGDGGPPGGAYPADGTPSLTGAFVTSFAEQYGGYEDAAESFTAFVMLDPLPSDNSVAGQKVRSFAEVPGYEELRLALRVTEPGGGAASVPDAPLVEYVLDIHNPSWLWGTWEGEGPNGPVQYVIDEFGVVFRETFPAGTEELDWTRMRDDGTLATVTVLGTSDGDHTYQVALADAQWLEIFLRQTDGISVERSDWGFVPLIRVGN